MVYTLTKGFENGAKNFLDLYSYLSILEVLCEHICSCCVNTVYCRNQYYFKRCVLK